MADVREVKVNISLAEYTRLAICESDFAKVKALVNSVKDNDYMGSDAFSLLKLLCAEKGEKG